jgi:hypothetical protein
LRRTQYTTDEILLDSEVPDSQKTIAKVEIKFAKNTTNGNSRKAGLAITVLLWLIKSE